MTETIIALLRGLHVAAVLSLVGIGVFRTLILPSGYVEEPRLRRRLRLLGWGSVAVALIAGAGWLIAEAQAMADAAGVTQVMQAVPLVATSTRFGEVLLCRFALVLLAAVAVGLRGRVGGVLLILPSVSAVAMQGLLGHAGAAEGATGHGLLVSEALHLTAAGAWLGALLPLWIGAGCLPRAQAAEACERFTPVGLACVMVLAASGLIQAIELIGNLPALAGTPYGQFALLKILLFLCALVLALINRLWLTDHVGATGSVRGLRLSVAIEAAIGLGIVLTAGFLATSAPAAHTEPVWPLSWRFSLETVNEDADFRTEVVTSAVLVGAALILLLVTVIRRRMRLLSLAVAVGIIVWRAPSFSLLTVEAYPTSFQYSTTDFSAESILRGQRLFAANCTGCHGAQGRGDGPAALGLAVRPANLTEPHVLEHPDGDMMWWMSHGMEGPEGGLVMPGFAASLRPEELWSLIDYARVISIGAAIHAGALPGGPVRAPTFPIACKGIAASVLDDLRGDAVLILADTGQAEVPEIPPQDGISTVAVSLRRDDGPVAPGCVAQSTDAWPAYAALAGTSSEALGGSAFLVDPNGWLRAIHSPGVAGGWHTDAELITSIRGILGSPISASAGVSHDHHH
jgi:putative copper export protein/mono/diheme cytochrome c family protein